MDFSGSQRPIVPIYKTSNDNASDGSDQEQPHPSSSKSRHATVYDAVAGMTRQNFMGSRETHSMQGKVSDSQGIRGAGPRQIKHSTKKAPLAPDEVLFRRKDAPERYYEYDIYHAHERELPHGGQGVLPESDLLKAIHGYTSKFYHAKDRDIQTMGNWNVNERSMDETALLALGILLEEAGKEILGRRGDLVFTEGAEDVQGSSGGGDGGVARDDFRIVGHQDVGLRRRGPKRRKVADPDDE